MYLVGQPSDRDIELLEESIAKLFQEVFGIDIKTCTEGEWTEKISIKGGALKQWQALINSKSSQAELAGH